MQLHEMQPRRVSKWESMTIPQTDYNFRIRAVPSPAAERPDNMWRLDSIIANAQSGTTIVADVFLFVTSQSVKDQSPNYVGFPLPGLTNQFPDLNLIGVISGISGPSELDFHPILLNSRENLGIFFSIRNVGDNPALTQFGYSLSYTILTNR